METTIPATAADTVSEIIDVVVELDRVISSIRGLQAQLFNQARRASDPGAIGSSFGAAVGKVMRLRALQAELAELRVSERTAEIQRAVSELLDRDPGNARVGLLADQRASDEPAAPEGGAEATR